MHLKKTAMSALLLFALASPAEATLIPGSCYRQDGFVDLAMCKKHVLEIPQELLKHGYYNDFGDFEPGMLDPELWTFDAGVSISGNVLRMSNRLAKAEIAKYVKTQGIDGSKVIGALATDSARYLNTFAWIRRKGSKDPFIGPVLVTSTAAPIHMRERACKFQSVGDLNSSVYYQLGGDTGTLEVEIYFTSTDSYDAPDHSIGSEQFVDYSSEFLRAAGYSCP